MTRSTNSTYATAKTEKVALLGDGRILIGSRAEDEGRYKFTIQHNASRGEVPAIDDDHTKQRNSKP